ncbi:MAG TPA: ABC transporter ATP-binding protein [Alphaproteobacteria bacterium]|jgi:iron(III) transport system ATP-binding protein
MQNFIDIQNLQKRFGSFTALHGLNLQIRQGEFFTLLGPSGCGKTTSLRLIGGLEKPDGGSISVGGECLASPTERHFVNPEKRNMGMVFQSYALWPHMTVFENVAYPLKLRWMKKAVIRQKVEEALALVGLAGLGDRPTPALSGGQQQRVALARALVFSPRVLLLDEPLSNLDAQLRDDMRKELKALQERLGLTVVMVTHDQTEALSLSHRLAILNQGRLEQVGTPEEVYHRPATSFARDFLGKMFALSGKVTARSSGRIDVQLGGADAPVLAVERFNAATDGLDAMTAADIMVAIRPEQIAVTDRAPAKRENVLPATVRSAQFLGDCYEYHMAIGAEERTLVLPASHIFHAGQQVYLQLQPEKITLWWTEKGVRMSTATCEDDAARQATAGVLDMQAEAARRVARAEG